jgi:hypothetical protein
MTFAEKLLSQRGPRDLMDKKILLLSQLRGFAPSHELVISAQPAPARPGE